MEYLTKTVYFDAYSWIPKDMQDSLIELGLRLSKLSTFIEGEPKKLPNFDKMKKLV
jgi:hypothetical protein